MNKENVITDIYFDKNYGKLYENVENGRAEYFHFKHDLGEVVNQFIIREITIKIDNNNYYDIVTPYGYGGPIILSQNVENKGELILQYYEAFGQYCKENNIVSEFIRFHPLLNNVEDFKDLYNVSCIRKTLGTNLRDFDDPFQSEFSKRCRQNIRKALRNGVTFQILEKPEEIGEFKKIYYSTMDRNNARDYYYFDDEYFNKILRYFSDNIIIVKALFEEKTIAQGLYLVYGNKIHIHLSGTLSEYLYLSPAYVLRYAVTLWGKENNYEIIHHGGGRTNTAEDGLFKFKKQFAKNTEFDFYVGKKIWNNHIYKELCEKENISTAVDFFPMYRYKL